MYVPKSNIIELSDREKEILKTIIHLYILNASPVGSLNLSRHLEDVIKLSSATIRNVMSDLEDMELISHPHTSAGRVPTDKGYRFYVDWLMGTDKISKEEYISLKNNISNAQSEDVLKNASKILGMLSNYLGIVEFPDIKEMIIHRIELIPLSSSKLIVVVALESNYVNSVTLEAEFIIKSDELHEVSSYINQLICGKPLKYVKENFSLMLHEYAGKGTGIVRLFMNSFSKIFDIKQRSEKLHISGAPYLLDNPEFENLDRVKGIIELIEDEDIIIHLLDKYEEATGSAKVIIGSEMEDEQLKEYALVVSSYKVGAANGAIGLIGPKRMQYSKMISLVQSVSDILTETNS